YAVGAADVVRRAIDRIRARDRVATLDGVANVIGVPPQRMRFWRDVNAVPLPHLARLLQRAGIGNHELGPTLTLKSKTGRRTVNVPRQPTTAMAHLAGLVAGDGHIAGACVELTGGEPAVRHAFADLCRELFGVAPVPRPGRSRCPTLVLGSSVAAELLTAVFGTPRGAKAGSVRAPDWLLAAP